MMTNNNERLLLVDGNSIAFRAFYALYNQQEKFTNQDGLHTSAIFGFKNMLDTMLKKTKPTHVLVAFDAGKTTFRTQKYDNYKGGRNKTPSELSEQFPYIKQLLHGLGITTYELANYEADDIIGTLAAQANAAKMATTIVTGDRDLTQLATQYTTVAVTKKGVSQIEDYTPDTIPDLWGVEVEQIVDMKALCGDSSDNYPGVTKVGEKTAIKLLNQYGSLDNLYARIDEMKPSKLKENLIKDKETAKMCQDLAKIRDDAPIALGLDDIKLQKPDEQQLAQLYEKLNMKRFLAQLKASDEAQKANENHELSPIEVVELTTAEDVAQKVAFNKRVQLFIQLDDANYHTAKMVGFSLKVKDTIYTSVDVSLLTQPKIKQMLEASDVVVDVFNTKATYVCLRRLEITLQNVGFDMLLVSYLLDTTEMSGDVGALAHLHGYTDIKSDADVFGTNKKWHVPEKAEFFDHLAHKTKTIAELRQPLLAKLVAHNQTNLYENVELKLAFVLAKMEIEGIGLDAAKLRGMQSKMQEQLADLTQTIYQLAGEEFNLNSPKQLGKILFEKLALPGAKKTKTGYSTAVSVLEKLVGVHPIIEKILEYRQLAKLASTYVEGLLRVQDKQDGKVHTRYLQTLTQTGRLSSVDPNLQNIPVRLDAGRKIRQAFVASGKNHVLLSADYSQIELRVLAHISGDENMQQAFKNDEDIHAKTARQIYHLNEDEEITYEMRRHAKAVNFGIVYGISAYGLSQSINVSRKAAKQFMEAYFEAYPKVKAYMDDAVATAKQNGYVETLLHRRRYLPEIKSKNFNLRAFAERTAMNTPIQGSAADIIKQAMINVDEKLTTQKLKTKMLLQVHDELIFDVPEDELSQVKALVAQTMDSAVSLQVPLKVEVGYGKTWYDIKK